MDVLVDMVEDDAMLDLVSLFDTTPDTFVFSEAIIQQILARRARMLDSLIFDMLLLNGKVHNPHAIYPPSDIPSLQRLLVAIETSKYDSMKKDCLVYMLLKWHRDDRSLHFAQARSIPPQFIALSDAYWMLDCGVDVPRAIALFADARLNRDYPSKILQVLSLSPNSHSLIRSYVRTAQPILPELADIELYATALAESNLMEAWQYQQTFPEGTWRGRLIIKLLRWSLTPKPRPQPLKQLLGYSLTTYEQTIIHAFATHPPSDLPAASITAIQDLVCLRLVLSGQVTAAVKLNRQFPTSPTSEGRRAAQERKQHMLDEAVTLLPAAERRLLELELERTSQNSDLSASGSSELWGSTVDLSMSMSWEHVSPPLTKTNGATSELPPRTSDAFKQSPATPIPKRAGAPRFAGPISALANSTTESPSFVLGRSKTSTQAVVTPPLASGSRVRSLAAKFQNSAPEPPAQSLFDKVGSANSQRNAFYEPPVSAKRRQSQPEDEFLYARSPADVSTASASAVVQELLQDEDDVHMDASDVEQPESEHHEPSEPEVEAKPEIQREGLSISAQSQTRDMQSPKGFSDDEDSRELPYSLFSSAVSSQPKKVSRASPSKKLPPGAFYAEDDEDSEAAAPPPLPPPSRPRKSEPKLPAKTSISAGRKQARTSEKSSTRPARPRTSTKSQELSRTLPGSLIDDHGDDDDEVNQTEEEDTVPPLPPISSGTSRRQPARKSRASKGGEAEKEREGTRPTRRSSRLSVVSASSRGSSSPEPPASPVKRRSTRASVATPKKKAGKQR